MVSGTEWPGGDPFLQRQNEPSMAASTRNPLHLLGGSNDYRTVDLPGLPATTDRRRPATRGWASTSRSTAASAGRARCCPATRRTRSETGVASPLKGYQAAADPVVRAGTSGLIYYNGLVFDRGEDGKSGIFVARFIDRNNTRRRRPGRLPRHEHGGAVRSRADTPFLDKPWMAVDIPRGNAPQCVVGGQPAPRRRRQAQRASTGWQRQRTRKCHCR